MKKLIISADDYGTSPLFDKVMVTLCQKGWVSSVSIMARRMTDAKGAKLLLEACAEKNISLGLHLDFVSWEEYEQSIGDQIRRFEEFFWQLPHHIDIHKDSPNQATTNAIIAYCNYCQIPHRNRGVKDIPYRHTDWERWVASRSTIEEIEQWMESLEDNKSYEIVFHPGVYDPQNDSKLNKEREEDIRKIEYLIKNLEKFGLELISNKDL